MTDSQREALLLDFVRRLKEGGSWCGETHIQKSTYFLQEFMDVPLSLNYTFYKHGPFSFDLNDRLTALRGNGFVELRSHPPYGPHQHATDSAIEYLGNFPKTISRFEYEMDFVVTRLAEKNVAELERLSTALYVRKQSPEASEEKLAQEMNCLKPHVTIPEALKALREVAEYEHERQ
jgi:uncharacterized protein YwgA